MNLHFGQSLFRCLVFKVEGRSFIYFQWPRKASPDLISSSLTQTLVLTQLWSSDPVSGPLTQTLVLTQLWSWPELNWFVLFGCTTGAIFICLDFVHGCACVCVSVCVWVSLWLCVSVCVYLYVCMCVWMCGCVKLCVFASECGCVWLCVCICMCLMCVCGFV